MIVQKNSIACQGVILAKKLADCCIIIAEIVNQHSLLLVSFSLDYTDITFMVGDYFLCPKTVTGPAPMESE